MSGAPVPDAPLRFRRSESDQAGPDNPVIR
jgi:hypothetical protein